MDIFCLAKRIVYYNIFFPVINYYLLLLLLFLLNRLSPTADQSV